MMIHLARTPVAQIRSNSKKIYEGDVFLKNLTQIRNQHGRFRGGRARFYSQDMGVTMCDHKNLYFGIFCVKNIY
jgi:hypothetical protein